MDEMFAGTTAADRREAGGWRSSGMRGQRMILSQSFIRLFLSFFDLCSHIDLNETLEKDHDIARMNMIEFDHNHAHCHLVATCHVLI